MPNHAVLDAGAAAVGRRARGAHDQGRHARRREAGERLVTTLFALPLDGDRRNGARRGMAGTRAASADARAVPPIQSEIVEERLMAGLAGRMPGRRRARVIWEGQQYRVDLAHGERQRLKAVREKQQGYSVDLAMTLDAAAQELASDGLTIDRVREVAAQFAGLPETFESAFECAAGNESAGRGPAAALGRVAREVQ